MNRSLLLYITVSFFSLFTNTAYSEKENGNFSIDMPSESLNGSFVVRVDYPEKVLKQEAQLELWRRYEDEEFTLISRQPFFDAISQMLYIPGSYEYQVKIVRSNGDNLENIATSELKKINVELRHSQWLSSLP